MNKARKLLKDMFEMANLWPEDTGLPVVIWVEEGSDVSKDQHGPRMKVMIHPGEMNYQETVTVTLDEPPHLIGSLEKEYFNKVKEFIKLNREALMAHWNHEISTVELGRRIKKLEDKKRSK